jgi:DNA-binding response OmpR family regulator
MKALVAVESPADLNLVASGLRERGLNVVVGAGAEQARKLAIRSEPDVAIVVNGATGSKRLVGLLEDRKIPMVFIGSPDDLARAADIDTVVAGVPSPCQPEDIIRAIETAVGEPSIASTDDVTTVGPLRIDPQACVVFLADKRLELPPKTFALLAELAHSAGTPVTSAQLLRRVWPDANGMTTDDVHRHMYRLRTMLDDHRRVPPLISNRRGFGYVLADRTDTQPESMAVNS